MTCAPIMMTTGRRFFTAVTVAVTISRKSLPTRMCGSESRKAANDPPGCHGWATAAD